MRSLYAATAVGAVFDEANLIADAGLVPLVAWAEQVGLPDLVAEHLAIVDADNSAGANPAAKVVCRVAGMAAGADSTDDLDRLRQTGNRPLFADLRALPRRWARSCGRSSTGTCSRLNPVLRASLVALMERVDLLPGSDQVVFVDVDSTHCQVYGYAKQGAGHGRSTGRRTLPPLIATVSTPIADPGVAGIRLRPGKSADVRGGGWPRPSLPCAGSP